jgi:hypothetical protein
MTEEDAQDDRPTQSTTPYRNAYRDLPDQEDEATEEIVEDTTEDPGPTSFMATQEEVDYKKRYDDLKRHYDVKNNEHKQELERRDAERTVEERMEKASLRSPEQLAEFRSEYSEVYDTVETLATQAANERVAEMEAKYAKLEEKSNEDVAAAAFNELLSYHPDFNEVSKSAEFHTWLGEQPEGISQGVTNNNTDARWAAKVISLYKTETGVKSTKRRSKDVSAAMEVSAGGRPQPVDKNAARIWKRSEIQALKPREYDKMEKELDLARDEGRIING